MTPATGDSSRDPRAALSPPPPPSYNDIFPAPHPGASPDHAPEGGTTSFTLAPPLRLDEEVPPPISAEPLSLASSIAGPTLSDPDDFEWQSVASFPSNDDQPVREERSSWPVAAGEVVVEQRQQATIFTVPRRQRQGLAPLRPTTC